MANVFYNAAKAAFLNGDIDWVNDDIRVLLVGSGYAVDAEHDFVADITNELSGTGYVRKALASKAVNIDTVNDRAEADAADVVWTGLDAGTIAAAVVYKFVTNDADSPLICFIDPVDKVTNGGDITLQFSADGVFYW